jgi:hypothetical protein
VRQAILYPGEDGYWVVECPSLPGCISQGKTKEEAVQNIREAIEGYVLLFKMTACLSHQSALTRFCLQYDQVASDLGASLRSGSWKSGLSSQSTTWQPHHTAPKPAFCSGSGS